MRFPVKKGQIIYVEQSNMFINTSPNLSEYVITSVNSRSFYAKRKDSQNDYKQRFDKKTGISHSIDGFINEAYPHEETYNAKIEKIKKTAELKIYISKNINKLKLEDLIKIEKYIKKIMK